MNSTQIKIAQRCASHWNQAERWLRAQRPDRSRRDARPFNTIGAQVAAKVPQPRLTLHGLPVN